MVHIDISGSTSVCFIIGKPIAQVKTPAVFNAWAARTGADAVLVPLALAETGVKPFFQAMGDWENCPGCIVTYPYKQAAYACLHDASETAAFLGACNVVRRDPDGRLVGAITDGLGYAKALVARGVPLEGSDFLLIGAGGAGAAIGHEVARRGVARLAVLELDETRRDTLLRRLEEAFPTVRCFCEPPKDFRFDVACNATPLGMHGEPRLPFPVERLGPATVVTDVVPDPAVTPFLAAARDRGLRIQTGPEMVEGQFAFVIGHLFPAP